MGENGSHQSRLHHLATKNTNANANTNTTAGTFILSGSSIPSSTVENSFLTPKITINEESHNHINDGFHLNQINNINNMNHSNQSMSPHNIGFNQFDILQQNNIPKSPLLSAIPTSPLLKIPNSPLISAIPKSPLILPQNPSPFISTLNSSNHHYNNNPFALSNSTTSQSLNSLNHNFQYPESHPSPIPLNSPLLNGSDRTRLQRHGSARFLNIPSNMSGVGVGGVNAGYNLSDRRRSQPCKYFLNKSVTPPVNNL